MNGLLPCGSSTHDAPSHLSITMKGVYTVSTGHYDNPAFTDENGVRKRQINGDVVEVEVNDTPPSLAEGREEVDLLYEVQDYPPIHITLIYGLQLALINVSFSVTMAILVANAFCADPETTAKLTSTTLFMAGLSTMIQTALGIRLPIFQGPNPTFLVPLLNMKTLPEWQCPNINGTSEITSVENRTDVNAVELLSSGSRMELVSGSLLAASAVHMFLGGSGLMGLLMRFIGPLTISPVLILIAVSLVPPTAELMEAHWGVAAFTFLLFLIMTAYMEFIRVPMPAYNKQQGCHVSPYPVFQVLAILVSLGLGWILSYILTATGTFTDDKDDVEYKARTDFNAEAITKANWFYFPYPTQFGPLRFDLALFLGMVMCVFMSVVESLGDYIAVGNVCGVPRAPSHALNRGILAEGVGSAVSAMLGAGHGTTSYSEMISAIGLTKVGSRFVFIIGGFIMMILGVVGKLSAILINIPYPVLGGLALLTLGTLLGMGIEVLHSVNLTKSRTVISIGLSIVLGILIPEWVREKTADGQPRIQTGTRSLDHVLLALLGNEVFVGGFIGFILDSTLPGQRSRFDDFSGKSGDKMLSKEKQKKYERLYELPFIPSRAFRGKWARFVPFLPYHPDAEASDGTS